MFNASGIKALSMSMSIFLEGLSLSLFTRSQPYSAIRSGMVENFQNRGHNIDSMEYCGSYTDFEMGPQKPQGKFLCIIIPLSMNHIATKPMPFEVEWP
jgi:hypothetical protein